MTPTEQVKMLRAVMLEHNKRLKEIWGKEEDPYAYALGWVRIDWDAALAATQDAAPQPDLLAVAERVAMECAYLVRHPSGPEGEDGYNLDDIAQRIEHLDLAALLKETP